MRAALAARPRTGRATVRVVALLLSAFGFAAASAQQSASFRVDRVTLAAGAGPISSASYVTTITIAQEGPVGSVSRCNDGFLQSTGFWSVLGESPVPVWLLVDKDDSDPPEVELTWSGSSSLFTLYRSGVAESLIDPLNVLLTTPECAVTDAPPAAPITFYLVSPTGP